MYRVGYIGGSGLNADRELHPSEFATLERATKVMNAYKRRGRTAWVETADGTHVPVKGAMAAPKPSWFTKR